MKSERGTVGKFDHDGVDGTPRGRSGLPLEVYADAGEHLRRRVLRGPDIVEGAAVVRDEINGDRASGGGFGGCGNSR